MRRMKKTEILFFFFFSSAALVLIELGLPEQIGGIGKKE